MSASRMRIDVHQRVPIITAGMAANAGAAGWFQDTITEAACAHFPRVIAGGERTDLLALHRVLSHGRHEAVIWSPGKDQFAWLDCQAWAFQRRAGQSPCCRKRSTRALNASGRVFDNECPPLSISSSRAPGIARASASAW